MMTNIRPKVTLKFVLVRDKESNGFKRALIFDFITYSTIRKEFNIAGTLIGTSPTLKQQNKLLELPCEVNIFEVYWILEYIIDQEGQNYDYQLLVKGDGVLKEEPVDPDYNPNNNSTRIPFENRYINKSTPEEYHIIYLSLKKMLQNDLDYQFYKYLKLKFKTVINSSSDETDKKVRYPCLLSGLKYGCLYSLYMDDPLKEHSRYMVKNFLGEGKAPVSSQLQSDCRLATSTKKEVLITYLRYDNSRNSPQYQSYAFKWPGF